jgi:hypothetical protein
VDSQLRPQDFNQQFIFDLIRNTYDKGNQDQKLTLKEIMNDIEVQLKMAIK